MYCFIYDATDENAPVFVEYTTADVNEAGQATTKLTLATKTNYKLVFWASANGKTEIFTPTTDTGEGDVTVGEGEVSNITGGDDDPVVDDSNPTSSPLYTINTATGAMTVDYSQMTGNNGAEDAFYYEMEFVGGNQAPNDLKLYRPFAQVNFGTSDYSADSKVLLAAYGKEIYSSFSCTACTSLDMLNNTVSLEDDYKTEFTTTRIDIADPDLAEDFPVDPATYKYMASAYVLAPAGGMLSNITFNTYNSAGALIHTVPVTDAPLHGNFRTNIYGSLLTSTTDFSVSIMPNFVGSNNHPIEVSNRAQLEAALNSGASVVDLVVTGKIDAPTEGGPIVVGKEVIGTPAPGEPTAAAPQTVNMVLKDDAFANAGFVTKGHTVLNVYSAPATPAAARRRATRGGVANTSFTADEYSTINIFSGNFTSSNGTLCHANDGGHITIKGGQFATTAADASQLLKKTETGVLTVSGGSFVGFNPSAYVATGLYCVGNAGVWTVTDQRPSMQEPVGAPVYTSWDALAAAVNAAESGSSFIVDGTMQFTAGTSTPISVADGVSKNITIYLRKGSIINVSGAESKYPFDFKGGKLTIGGEGKIISDYIAINMTKSSALEIDGGEYITTSSAHIINADSNSGETKIQSGRFEATNPANSNGPAVLGSPLVINDGEFISASPSINSAAARLTGSKYTITINGGKFTGTGMGLQLYQCGNVTINGGKFTGTEMGSHVLRCSKVTINGGEFTGSKSGIHIIEGTTGTYTVTGGKFNGTDVLGESIRLKFDTFEFTATSGTYILTGGMFSTKPKRGTEIALPATHTWTETGTKPYGYQIVKK